MSFNSDTTSGTYVPTCSAAAGITSVGNGLACWKRIGNVISIGGTFTLQPSTLTGQVAFYMSSPPFVTANYSTSNMGGVAHPGNIAVLAPPMNIVNEGSGLRILFNGSNLAHTSNNAWSFSLTGQIN